jgi:predicted RNase H-like HicB family nuclease
MQMIDYVVWQEEDQYVSQCLNVDIASCGDTREEAIANLRDALELYFRDDDQHDIASVRQPQVGKIQVNA